MSASAPFVLAAGIVSLYGAGVRRYNRRHPSRPFPLLRAAAFALGVAAAAIALGPPLDGLSAWLLSAHMAQHLLLMLVAAPLLLVGTPLRLARQSGVAALESAAARLSHSRLVAAITWPPAAWALFAAVLAGSHFTPLYEAALEHPAVHVLEHALYMSAALVFWYPVVGLEPSRWRLGYGLRLLYLASALPVQSLLGLAIFSSRHVLYPHYAVTAAVRGTSALADQQTGGVIMWLGGGLPVIAALLLTAAAWAAEDRRLADHLDRAARSSCTSPTSAAVTPPAPATASHQP
ncbi:MAG: cytochrome c oxidase assembly protein [bacterium]